MRVHELAKELNAQSKDILAVLKRLKIPVKSHASALDAGAQQRVREALAPSGAPPKSATPGAPPKSSTPGAAPKAQAAPKAAPRPRRTPSAKTAPPAKPSPLVPTAAASAPPALEAPAPPAKPAPPEETPVPAADTPVAPPPKRLELRFPITVGELANKLQMKPSELIKQLMQQGIFASLTQSLDETAVMKVAPALAFEVAPQPSLEEQLLKTIEPDPAKFVARGPVVTFMGHVDHGKTSLLDAIRKASVASQETGGITQHIGAYAVQFEKGRVTFVDTPGHEAFTALRARGANVTDIVVLVVAADDGVMPQTIEAMDHARAADVPIVVAINKVDRPDANVQRVKQQLSQHNLLSEDWGGKTIMVEVSAKTRQGLDALMEMLLLESEMLELRADPTIPARGVVVEARQTKNRGPVATLLVQQGTLRVGDPILVGAVVGRIRAMSDDLGHRLKEAGPAQPVEVLGLPSVPQAGDKFFAVSDEKAARQVAGRREDAHRTRSAIQPKRITLEELHARISEGKLKDLRFILKADVQGSLEAIIQSLEKLDDEKEEVQFKILHSGVGDINESDVILAAASDAIIFGFHVGINPEVQVLAAKEGVDVHIYQIIYDLISALKAAIEGLLEPRVEETFMGRAEVRKIFQVSKVGMIAGCMVIKGSIRRDGLFRVIRGRDRIFEGKLASLKRVKDDAREVQEGLECGLALSGNVDLQVGDLVEAWEIKHIARTLG
ncbi:MAG TPA: translation initiation factor IF-2 [bacterium]